MLTRFIYITILISLLLSCNKKVEFEEIEIKGLAQNSSLPKNLILEMVKHFKSTNPDLKMNEKDLFNKFGFFSKEVWPIEVKLWNDKEGIAKVFKVFDSSARLDLNSVVSKVEGDNSFNMQIKIKTQKLTKMFVYFIPSLKDEKETCSDFYEISSFYQKKISQLVVLSKKNKHYLRNYIGTYVFFSPMNKDLYQLNILQLTDSSKRELLCTYL